jgi:hypothetical protein
MTALHHSRSGFFNIVHSDDDPENILSIKARRREHLMNIKRLIYFQPVLNGGTDQIQESAANDYRFRAKALRPDIRVLMSAFADQINYPKSKPVFPHEQDGDARIWLNVWDDLCALQSDDAI